MTSITARVRRTHLGPAMLLASFTLAACSSDDAGTNPLTILQRSPCTGGAAVSLSALQSVRIDCGNHGSTVTLAGGGASYLIVPELATDNAADTLVPYRMFVTSGVPATQAMASRRTRPSSTRLFGDSDGRLRPLRPNLAQLQADRLLRARARSAWTSQRRSAGTPPSAAIARDLVPPSVGSTRAFRVMSNLSTSSFQSVGARLAYVGSNVLVYVDTLSPANGFTADQLHTFGRYFDQTLYDIDTTAFGPPTDIDQNGHVIMLMTPVVNTDTPSASCQTEGYVAGFFLEDDFNGTADQDSNHGEVFYSIVPDPNGTLSCAHTVADMGDDLPATFLHELQHLINFGQHVVVDQTSPGSSWMDEGMSIVAEELGSRYWENKCPPPSCRTDAAQLFPDSGQGFAQGFLYDSYQYALLPDTASLTLHVDSDDGFSWRGGDWLLMHWLGDQNGSGIYRILEHGPSDGVAAIEAATGQTFGAVMANFGLSLYTDSLPGLPRATAPATNRFTTRNVKQLWARLYATSSGTDVPRPDPLQLFPITTDSSVAVIVPGTVTYFRLDTPVTAAPVTIEFSGPAGVPLPPTLAPQLAIFRLPPGQ